jgi:hypothetical protein
VASEPASAPDDGGWPRRGVRLRRVGRLALVAGLGTVAALAARNPSEVPVGMLLGAGVLPQLLALALFVVARWVGAGGFGGLGGLASGAAADGSAASPAARRVSALARMVAEAGAGWFVGVALAVLLVGIWHSLSGALPAERASG